MDTHERIPIWGGPVDAWCLPNVGHSWRWVCCVSPFCGHARAVPLAPWRIRWGTENVDAAIRRKFRCGVCGTKGCVFQDPAIDSQGVAPFPAGREVWMSGPKNTFESLAERDTRVLAEYVARFGSSDALGAFRGGPPRPATMCNLYSVTKSQQAIRDFVKAIRDLTGNLPPLPAVFPNRLAPIVRAGSDGVRELLMARWGFPPPSIPGSKPRNPYLTNVRNTESRYWRAYLEKPPYRCLVPVTSFAEPDNNQGPRSIWTWFAQDDSRPLMFFAGIWREWEGDRGTKTAPDIGKHLVFSFLTTDASPDVAPIHPDATPVLLLNEAAREQWLNAPIEEALLLQKPPPAGALKIVATGEKQDVR